MANRLSREMVHRKPVPREAGTAVADARSPRLSVKELAEEIASTGGGSDDQMRRSADDIAPALEFSWLDLGSRESPPEELHDIPRSSLDKPLPSLPSQPRQQYDDAFSGGTQQARRVAGVLDLKNNVETQVHQHIAPAVTRETIIENVHEIREERITREIHKHEIYHRILPIKDAEVLPARHFVKQSDGSLSEVSGRHLPGRDTEYTQRLLEEVFKDTLPKCQEDESPESGPRSFTARNFEDEDESEHRPRPKGPRINPATETQWVHPPTVATNPDSVPFHLGSADPKDDGFR